MILSVTLLLVLAAFCTVVLSALGKAPLWVPVFILVVIAALQVIPLK